MTGNMSSVPRARLMQHDANYTCKADQHGWKALLSAIAAWLPTELALGGCNAARANPDDLQAFL